MNRHKQLLLATVAISIQTSFGQLSIPSDGSDGALIITTNTVINLGLAGTGPWDANNSTNAGNGIYDPDKWAVVFKYSTVNIAAGATVTFSNHPSRAPVVWLVNGSVTNYGHVKLDGQTPSFDNVNVPEGGPGAFRGGAKPQSGLGRSGGFGPGGAYDGHGSYSVGYAGFPYGNPQIVPLVGGSGGSSSTAHGGINGGGGGGAILIAAANAIALAADGSITAAGGSEANSWWGSGGAIRLVANQIFGSGRLDAGSAFHGRVRLEANSASAGLSINPPTVAVSPSPLVIWPSTNAPTVRVVSVDGQSAPLDPRANLHAGGDDMTISTRGTNTITLQTANFPTNGTVNVFIKPRNSLQATLQASYVAGTFNLATWRVLTVLPVHHTIIQARAVAQ